MFTYVTFFIKSIIYIGNSKEPEKVTFTKVSSVTLFIMEILGK
jgi:hypothetical protein